MRLLVLDSLVERSAGFVAALRACGYTPDQLDRLEDAVEALSLTPYSGMVLRRRFPDGDAIPWLCERRARGLPIPAVMVMGASSVEDRVLALDAGADDCVQLPIDDRELVARVRAVLRRPRVLELSLLRAGNIVLDRRSREVWINEAPVLLPRRELCLLEHLMRRFRRVVPREMLEDNLYGYADGWCANSLEVRLSRVRRHLASASADVAIHTVRAVGYTLQPI